MIDTITVATFQVLNSYMWLVATILHRAIQNISTSQKGLLHSAILEPQGSTR